MFLSSEITVWNKGKSYSMESLWLQLPWITVLSTLLHFLSTLWDTQHVVMKYEMHAFHCTNLSLEMWGLWFENKHDSKLSWEVSAAPTARSHSPCSVSLLHSISLILHFPCDKLLEVSVKRKITFHYPQEMKWPFCCHLDDTWAACSAETKARIDLFSLKKAKYWKNI